MLSLHNQQLKQTHARDMYRILNLAEEKQIYNGKPGQFYVISNQSTEDILTKLCLGHS